MWIGAQIFLERYKLPRTLMLTAVLLLACASHLLIVLGMPQSLYAASVVIGFCFSAQWPLVFAIVSEVFELKYYSTLYNSGNMARPVGSYILNGRIIGRLYDAEVDRQPDRRFAAAARSDKVCFGVQCFKRSFLIITAATVFGALVSLVLVWRTWSFYKGDIYARFWDDAGEGQDGCLPVDQRQQPPQEVDSTAVNGTKG